jgi:TP901 family phage tail tape measure protein
MARDDTMVMELRLRLDKAERELSRFVKKAERTQLNIKGIDHKKFTQPLGKITGSVSEFQKSLDASNARVIAFSASAGILMGVTKAFTEMARATVNVEKKLVDINVILGATNSNLQTFGQGLFNVARQTGQSFDMVADAATEFSRQGLTMEKTLTRTRDALILTRLSGMDAEAAVNALTAALNSFNKTSLTSTEIVNRMANVDAAFAVSTNDLAEAIRRVGATAEDVNVSFNQMLAMVTSVQQTTARGGNVIGNSLKTIFTRIQRTEVINQLEQLGVTVRKANGEMRPAIDSLTDFAKVYDTLPGTLKSSTAELVGGVYQMNILKSMLKDLKKETSVYSSALALANNTTDQAILRNKELNKTLAATVNETMQNLTEMGAGIGKMTLEPLFKRILDGFNSLSKDISFFGDIGEFLGFSAEEGNKFGSDLAGGIMKSIGNILSGPGFVALGAIVGKLFIDFTRFLSKSVADFANLNKNASQQAALQQQIHASLAANPQLIDQITSKEISREQAEQKILAALKQEIQLRERISALAEGSGGRAQAAGFGAEIDKSSGTTTITHASARRKKASGFVPNFSDMDEFVGALAGGYKPGDIKKTFIQGEGNVTYNSAEKIKKFPGMEQRAIMPPETSGAGKKYKEDFKDRHGFNPYASKGFVPNLLNVLTSMRTIFDKKGAGRTGSMGDMLSASRENLMKSQGVPPWLQGVLGSALRPGELVRIKTMGQLSGITAGERAPFASGKGKNANLKGGQMESALAGRKGNFSWKRRFAAPGGTGELGKMPVDLGTKSKTGRNYPIESKPELKTKQIGSLFLKTLYENNSGSLKQLRSRLKAKADAGDTAAGAHLDKLQSVMTEQTGRRGGEISKYSAGNVNSLSDFNSQVGFDSKNAIAGLREKQRGMDVFSGGFVPNFVRKKGKGQASQKIIDATKHAAMLLPEGGAGKQVTGTIPASQSKTGSRASYKFNTFDPDISKRQKKSLHDKVGTAVTKVAIAYAKKINGGDNNPLNSDPDPSQFFNTGAMKAATGTVFEAAIDAAFGRSKDIENAIWDVKSGTPGYGEVMELFKAEGIKEGDYKNSASAGNLKSMAKKIQNSFPRLGATYNTKKKSGGFVPNFSSVSDAFDAESAFGGDPELRTSPFLHVADKKTQKNWSAVKADHPEGIAKATRNSKAMQQAVAAQGHIPNFATGMEAGMITAGFGMLGMGAMQLKEKFGEVKTETDRLTAALKESEEAVDTYTQTLADSEQALKDAEQAETKDDRKVEKADKSDRGVERAAKKEAKINLEKKKDFGAGEKHGPRSKAYREALEKETRRLADSARTGSKELKDRKRANRTLQRDTESVRARTEDNKKATIDAKKAHQQARNNLAAAKRAERARIKEASAHNRSAAMGSGTTVGGGRRGMVRGGGGGRKAMNMGGAGGMGGMMMLPMVGGMARGVAGGNEKAGGVISGAETAGSFAMMGAMTGSPHVAIAAATIGVLVGGFQALDGFLNPMKDLQKAAEKANEEFTNFSNASQKYLSVFESFNEAQDDLSVNADEYLKRSDAVGEAFLDLPAEIRTQFAYVKNDAQSIAKFFADAAKELEDRKRQSESQVVMQTQYENERGWFVDFTRDLTGLVGLQAAGRGGGMPWVQEGDRIFDKSATGKQSLADFTNFYTRETDVKQLDSATMTRLEQFADTLGQGMTDKQLGNFQGILRSLNLPDSYVARFKELHDNTEDASDAAKNYVEELKEIKLAEEKRAKLLKERAAALKVQEAYEKHMSHLAHTMKILNVTVKENLGLERDRIKTLTQLKFNAEDFRIDLVKLYHDMGVKMAEPFVGKVEKASMGLSQELAKINIKMNRSIRSAISSSIDGGFDLISKEFFKSASTLESILGNTGKSESGTDTIKVRQAQKMQTAIGPLIKSMLLKMEQQPRSFSVNAADLQKLQNAIRNAGGKNAQLNAEQVGASMERLFAGLQNKITLLEDEARRTRMLAEERNELQKAMLRQQEKLSMAGGGSDYLERGAFGLSANISNMTKVFDGMKDAYILHSGRAGVGGTSIQEGDAGKIGRGRAAFALMDNMVNNLNLRGPQGDRLTSSALGSQLMGQAVGGRAEDIKGQLSYTKELLGILSPGGLSKDLSASIAEAEGSAFETAAAQIASELKTQDIAPNVEEINQNVKILNKIIESQGLSMYTENKKAFHDALVGVGVTGSENQKITNTQTISNEQGFRLVRDTMIALNPTAADAVGIGIGATTEKAAISQFDKNMKHTARVGAIGTYERFISENKDDKEKLNEFRKDMGIKTPSKDNENPLEAYKKAQLSGALSWGGSRMGMITPATEKLGPWTNADGSFMSRDTRKRGRPQASPKPSGRRNYDAYLQGEREWEATHPDVAAPLSAEQKKTKNVIFGKKRREMEELVKEYGGSHFYTSGEAAQRDDGSFKKKPGANARVVKWKGKGPEGSEADLGKYGASGVMRKGKSGSGELEYVEQKKLTEEQNTALKKWAIEKRAAFKKIFANEKKAMDLLYTKKQKEARENWSPLGGPARAGGTIRGEDLRRSVYKREGTEASPNSSRMTGLQGYLQEAHSSFANLKNLTDATGARAKALNSVNFQVGDGKTATGTAGAKKAAEDLLKRVIETLQKPNNGGKGSGFGLTPEQALKFAQLAQRGGKRFAESGTGGNATVVGRGDGNLVNLDWSGQGDSTGPGRQLYNMQTGGGGQSKKDAAATYHEYIRFSREVDAMRNEMRTELEERIKVLKEAQGNEKALANAEITLKDLKAEEKAFAEKRAAYLQTNADAFYNRVGGDPFSNTDRGEARQKGLYTAGNVDEYTGRRLESTAQSRTEAMVQDNFLKYLRKEKLDLDPEMFNQIGGSNAMDMLQTINKGASLDIFDSKGGVDSDAIKANLDAVKKMNEGLKEIDWQNFDAEGDKLEKLGLDAAQFSDLGGGVDMGKVNAIKLAFGRMGDIFGSIDDFSESLQTQKKRMKLLLNVSRLKMDEVTKEKIINRIIEFQIKQNKQTLNNRETKIRGELRLIEKDPTKTVKEKIAKKKELQQTLIQQAFTNAPEARKGGLQSLVDIMGDWQTHKMFDSSDKGIKLSEPMLKLKDAFEVYIQGTKDDLDQAIREASDKAFSAEIDPTKFEGEKAAAQLERYNGELRKGLMGLQEGTDEFFEKAAEIARGFAGQSDRALESNLTKLKLDREKIKANLGTGENRQELIDANKQIRDAEYQKFFKGRKEYQKGPMGAIMKMFGFKGEKTKEVKGVDVYGSKDPLGAFGRGRMTKKQREKYNELLKGTSSEHTGDVKNRMKESQRQLDQLVASGDTAAAVGKMQEIFSDRMILYKKAYGLIHDTETETNKSVFDQKTKVLAEYVRLVKAQAEEADKAIRETAYLNEYDPTKGELEKANSQIQVFEADIQKAMEKFGDGTAEFFKRVGDLAVEHAGQFDRRMQGELTKAKVELSKMRAATGKGRDQEGLLEQEDVVLKKEMQAFYQGQRNTAPPPTMAERRADRRFRNSGGRRGAEFIPQDPGGYKKGKSPADAFAFEGKLGGFGSDPGLSGNQKRKMGEFKARTQANNLRKLENNIRKRRRSLYMIDEALNPAKHLEERQGLWQDRLALYKKHYGQIWSSELNGEAEVQEAKLQMLKEYQEIQKKGLKNRIDLIEDEVWKQAGDETLYTDERTQKRRERTQASMRARKAGVKTEDPYQFKDSIEDIVESWQYGTAEMQRDGEETLFEVGQQLRSSTADAFNAIIDGTKTAKEAFGDMFQALGDMIQKQVIDMAVKRYLFDPVSSMFGGGSGPKGMDAAKGGYIHAGRVQHFATGGIVTNPWDSTIKPMGQHIVDSGGLVTGGNGYEDDVPAMVQQGEYVLRKSAVNKYGLSFMNSLNSGNNPIASNTDPQAQLDSLRNYQSSNQGAYAKFNLRNAFIYDSDRPTAGSGYAVDTMLSRRALMDGANPRNKVRREKVSKLYDYWASRRQEIQTWKESVDAYKKNKRDKMKNAMMIMVGNAALGKIFDGNTGYGGPDSLWNSWDNNRNSNAKLFAPADGELVPRANGLHDGHLLNNDMATAKGKYFGDTEAAMLMSGEYVISKDVVSRYGRNFFDQINSGRLRKMAKGGPVGAESTPIPEGGPDAASSGDMVNNITVNVTIDKDGRSESVSSGMGEEQGRELAQLIQSQITNTLIKEKRQGGILNG